MAELIELSQSDFSYSDEQMAVIEAAIEETKDTHNGFIEYHWSDRIVKRGNQIFAVFPWDAREAIIESMQKDDGDKLEILPVVVNGKMLLELPDEGRVGMAHLYRLLDERGNIKINWWVGFSGVGWLRVEELELPNNQIAQNIFDEIDAGANHFTGGS